MRAVPEVSVVLPYRDVSATLEEAARSILDDRAVTLELLLVDDGSRDGSVAVAERLAADDARVRLLSTGGRGIVGALNLGLSEARAGFVARMDGDDVSLPGRLARQLVAMREDPALAALGTQVDAFPIEVIEGGLTRYVAWQNALVTSHEHAVQVFVEAPLCHPSVMLRRDVVRALGGYREGPFPEDYDLWLRLAHAGHAMRKLPDVLLRWRQRPGRLTFNDARYSLENIRALRAGHQERLARTPRYSPADGAAPAGRFAVRRVVTAAASSR